MHPTDGEHLLLPGQVKGRTATFGWLSAGFGTGFVWVACEDTRQKLLLWSPARDLLVLSTLESFLRLGEGGG